MLQPKETSTRERKLLDGLWRFTLDPDGAGRDQQWWNRSLPGAREVPVPASYNDVFADAAIRDYVGEAWYQTTV
ncbi:MAG TPA: beta-glucuronidase, partial [Actinomycetota bacterium]|nr:beta-glucuronidase [Actinomycetota bacterium]